MIRRAPRSSRTHTLFPYTTLFPSDHGNLLFSDLGDHHGIAQVVVDVDSEPFKTAEAVRLESVITVTGKVVRRSAETINDKLPTGRVEVQAAVIEVQSAADTLPLQVNSDADAGEEGRLRYRFLDLRRQTMGSEERRVGKGCVSTGRYRWSP